RRVAEEADLLLEARERMPGDVEAERLLLEPDLLVGAPLRLVGERVLDARLLRHLAEEALARRRRLARRRGDLERGIEPVGERRAGLPQGVEAARLDQRLDDAPVVEPEVDARAEIREGPERALPRAGHEDRRDRAVPDALHRAEPEADGAAVRREGE